MIINIYDVIYPTIFTCEKLPIYFLPIQVQNITIHNNNPRATDT
jgi:hypothetical protein